MKTCYILFLDLDNNESWDDRMTEDHPIRVYMSKEGAEVGKIELQKAIDDLKEANLDRYDDDYVAKVASMGIPGDAMLNYISFGDLRQSSWTPRIQEVELKA